MAPFESGLTASRPVTLTGGRARVYLGKKVFFTRGNAGFFLVVAARCKKDSHERADKSNAIHPSAYSQKRGHLKSISRASRA